VADGEGTTDADGGAEGDGPGDWLAGGASAQAPIAVAAIARNMLRTSWVRIGQLTWLSAVGSVSAMIRAMSEVREPAAQAVTGRVSARRLGVTDAHDHLFLRSPALRGQELDDPARVAAEVEDAAATGVRTIVEATPIGLGRRPDLMRQLSEATGVTVIGATGFHRDAHYPADHWVYDAGEVLLLERLLADIEQGMHPADWLDPALPLDAARAGVIKVGASYQRITQAERRRLSAAAEASRRTGVPILAHTEIGTMGDEIVDLVEGAGVPANQVILAHLDRNPDPEVHVGLARRGVFLEYDTIGRIKYRPDIVLLELIEAIIRAGHGNRILLGLDLGQRDYFRSYDGGPGMRYLMTRFVPRLERAIGPLETRRILVDNPAHAFALREPHA
jgi:5-phospho-D-xylono-1,4-lactonase